MSDIICSFCSQTEGQVDVMIKGGKDTYICSECVENAHSVLNSSNENEIEYTDNENIDNENEDHIKKLNQKKAALKPISIFPPKEIKAKLDEYVIGQDDAKKVLSVAVYNHYKRLTQKASNDGVVIEKSNIVLVGETGTGKTYLAKNLANILNVPFCIVDATVFTEAGYVGEDVSNIISKLYQSAGYKSKEAERGIVYIDEIDKLARKGENPSTTQDVGREGVQQAILTLIEGMDVNVPPYGGRKNPEQKMVTINTKNILFICGGAFDGLSKIISRRISKLPVGFKSIESQLKEKKVSEENIIKYVTTEDLRLFGMIPELVGRLHIISYLNPLTKDMLKSILTQPKNALLKQYKKIFSMDDFELKISDDVLDLIVSKAIDLKLGARGLRNICESIFIDYMYELPSKKDSTEKTIEISESDSIKALSLNSIDHLS